MIYLARASLWLIVACFEFGWVTPGPGQFFGYFACAFVALNIVFAIGSIFSSNR